MIFLSRQGEEASHASYSRFSAFDPACPVRNGHCRLREPHRRFGSGRCGTGHSPRASHGRPSRGPACPPMIRPFSSPWIRLRRLWPRHYPCTTGSGFPARLRQKMRTSSSASAGTPATPSISGKWCPSFVPASDSAWGGGTVRGVAAPFTAVTGAIMPNRHSDNLHPKSHRGSAAIRRSFPRSQSRRVAPPDDGHAERSTNACRILSSPGGSLEASLRAGPESGRKRSTAFRQARPSGERRSLCTAHSGFRHGRNTGGSNSLARGSLERQLEIQHTENTSAACGRGGSGCGQDHPDGRVRGQ